jgi:hypothetical protein
LASNATNFFVTEGTNLLHILDQQFQQVAELRIIYDNHPIGQLTELEYVNGRIWANHETRSEILVIDPNSGIVEAYVNLAEFNQVGSPNCCFCHAPVASGIAYDADDDLLMIAGKYWRFIYKIRVSYRLSEADDAETIRVGFNHGAPLSGGDKVNNPQPMAPTPHSRTTVAAAINDHHDTHNNDNNNNNNNDADTRQQDQDDSDTNVVDTSNSSHGKYV